MSAGLEAGRLEEPDGRAPALCKEPVSCRRAALPERLAGGNVRIACLAARASSTGSQTGGRRAGDPPAAGAGVARQTAVNGRASLCACGRCPPLMRKPSLAPGLAGGSLGAGQALPWALSPCRFGRGCLRACLPLPAGLLEALGTMPLPLNWDHASSLADDIPGKDAPPCRWLAGGRLSGMPLSTVLLRKLEKPVLPLSDSLPCPLPGPSLPLSGVGLLAEAGRDQREATEYALRQSRLDGWALQMGLQQGKATF